MLRCWHGRRAGVKRPSSFRGTGEPGQQAAPLIWLVRKYPDTLERLDKITRLAKQRPARFEYWFMKASGAQVAAIAKLVENG